MWGGKARSKKINVNKPELLQNKQKHNGLKEENMF